MTFLGRDAAGILRDYSAAQIDAATTATFLARDANGILREYTATQLDTATATLHGRDSLGILRDYTAAAIAATISETPYYDAVIADAPVAWYRMGEASGSVVDTRGGTAGTTAGTVTRDVTGPLAAAGDNDGAITFNGTDAYVSVADQNALDLGDGPLSIECWFKRTTADVTGERCLVSKGQNAYALIFNDNTGEQLALAKDNVAVIVRETGSTNDALWHHVVVTKAGATVKLYKDGADVTGTVTDATLSNTTAALNIGRDVASSGSFWSGSIDEVALYDTVLSAARVLAHYNAGVGA